MKERKVFIIIGLIIFIASLNIGYAALNRNLQITGNAQVNKSAISVIFDSVDSTSSYPSDRSITKTASIISGTQASFNVSGLIGYNDNATAIYKIVNNGDLPANLSVNITNSNTTYFIVDYNLSKLVINPGENAYLTVKALVKKVSTSGNQQANIGATLIASY